MKLGIKNFTDLPRARARSQLALYSTLCHLSERKGSDRLEINSGLKGAALVSDQRAIAGETSQECSACQG